MIMTQKSGWTKSAVLNALEARTEIRLPKSAISITCSAKEMQWAKEEARREYRGGVFCIAGFGGVPDAIIYTERKPYDYVSFVTQILIRANRVSTILIDEIAYTIF